MFGIDCGTLLVLDQDFELADALALLAEEGRPKGQSQALHESRIPVLGIAERAPDAIEAATDEELALALELEVLGAGAVQAEDLAIIEQLDFVEMLRDLEGSGQRG